MRNFHWRKTLDWCPTINIDSIWTLVSKETLDKSKAAAGKTGAAVPVIDVTRVGIHKVLGKGVFPNYPVIVRAKLFSKKAEKKIQAAGGVCELTA
jgi:large subunit ribosomal protein L27Ae